MIYKTAEIKREILIGAEIKYCCSRLFDSYIQYVNVCTDYQRCQEQGELEDWEHAQWNELIDEAREEVTDLKRILKLLKKCYPQNFLISGETYENQNQ